MLVAIFAALVVSTGFITPSSVSASVLCSVNQSPCPAESTYEKGASFTFSASTADVGIGCAQSSLGGEVTAAGGESEPAKAEITHFTFRECYEEPAFCNVGAKNLPYEANFEGTGGNGTMTLSDPSHVGLAIQCSTFVCTYSNESIEFALTGGMPSILATSTPLLHTTGPFCNGLIGIDLIAEYSLAESPFPSMYVVDS